MTQRCCFGEPCDRDRINFPLAPHNVMSTTLASLPSGVTLCATHRAYAFGEQSPPPATVPRNLYPLHPGCGGALIQRRRTP